jgi:hypothetical protein
LLFQAILLFLFPVGLYCLLLAYLNRRQRPAVLSGAWDRAAMLAAGAGFFLVLLPTIFDHLYQRSYVGAVGGDEDLDSLWTRWWLVWLFYYLALVAVAALLIVWGRHQTVIYNVDTDLFGATLAQAVRLARLECQSLPEQPERLFLAAPVDAAGLNVHAGPAVAQVRIESFPAGCHVTLHWQSYVPAARAAVEQALVKIVEQARQEDNVLAGWFLILAGLVFGLISLVVIAVYLSIYLPLFLRPR